jgi:hypothetical protein
MAGRLELCGAPGPSGALCSYPPLHELPHSWAAQGAEGLQAALLSPGRLQAEGPLLEAVRAVAEAEARREVQAMAAVIGEAARGEARAAARDEARAAVARAAAVAPWGARERDLAQERAESLQRRVTGLAQDLRDARAESEALRARLEAARDALGSDDSGHEPPGG